MAEGKSKQELEQEIVTLTKSLEWYKNTYEKRSLLSIGLDRIKKKYFNRAAKLRVKIKKTSSSLSGKIICIIVNHNYSNNSTALHNSLSKCFDSLIIDSGSDHPPKNALKLENVYYSGLLNKAYEIAKENNYNYLLFVCSDVLILDKEAEKLFTRLSNTDLNKIGIYSPSSKGLSHNFCKKYEGNGLREVPFVEGFIFLADVSVLDPLCPINTSINQFGWGLDIAKSFFAKQKNKLCVIDDAVEVEHLAGTGYSREMAKTEMKSWINSLKNDELLNFYNNSISTVDF
jgi:hypothetical protein